MPVDATRESLVCPGCGCLCDDLDLRVEDGRIVEVNNVCLWGAGKFFAAPRLHPKKERHRLQHPQVRARGRWQQVSYEAALAQAAELLGKARRPVLYGLTSSGGRAQAAALALARKLGARLEPADLAFRVAYYQAVQRHGLLWAPLEAVRDEADTLLFWGANPLHSAPRHVVRYAVFARGRFTERGAEERRTAAVDLYRTEMAKFCRLFVRAEPSRELELLQGVITLLQGGEVPGTRARGTKRLAEFLAKAEYTALFCGRGAAYSQAAVILDGLARLAALLNEKGRCVFMPLAGDFNAAGLWHLLLSELGAAGAPDFRDPRNPEVHAAPVDFRETDAVLVTGADLLWFLPPEQVEDLKQREVPLLVISPLANRTTAAARVILPVALTGVEAADTAYRLDGLPLALRKIMPTSLPADYEVLRDLHRRS